MLFIFRGIPDPDPDQPEDEETLPVPDDDLFDWRLEAFTDMGFDYLTALALSWRKVSPSDCRERFLRREATHAQAADYYLD